jgi:hypothetical protein
MSSRARFLQLPPGYDPLAPRVVATNAFPAKRLIAVLRSDAKSDRYALHRFPDGSVSWRGDTFSAPEHPAEPECWIAYRGELTVGQVIEQVPDQRDVVLEWTRAEIVSGVELAGLENVHVAERRERSLERLRNEVAAAPIAASDRAA